MSGAYGEATDPVSLREEAGQVATARRDLVPLGRLTRPGALLDVGCWTGSLLIAARELGWEATGMEPSKWAVGRARERGLDVIHGELGSAELDPGSFRAVTCCDVLEHLADPGVALDRVHQLLEPGGFLYLTVPDAGSRLARLMGRHWWSVLPMHLQYFTRGSMVQLLEGHDFESCMVDRHAKVFTVRYYAERMDAFLPVGGDRLARTISRTPWADRLVAPDFGDRMAVLARRV